MPQMAPMNWLILFMIFSLTFFMFNTLNFFMYSHKPMTSLNLKKKHLLNWKW